MQLLAHLGADKSNNPSVVNAKWRCQACLECVGMWKMQLYKRDQKGGAGADPRPGVQKQQQCQGWPQAC